MKLHITVIAIALGSLISTSALAQGDDATIASDWDMFNSVYVVGDVAVAGDVRVNATSSAVVDQDQRSLLNLVFGDGDNSASVEGRALSDASGNIGVNIAAGAGNLQANDAALSVTDGDRVFSSAMVFSSQSTGANLATDFPDRPRNEVGYDANVTDRALSGASGNIGLNVAAGVGNAQTNALAASVGASGDMAAASADSEQSSAFNIVLALRDLDSTASLSGMSLSSASGNIGVNIAAGAGNAQHNGTSIAVAGGL